MLAKLLLAAGALIALLLIVIALQPSDFRVTRSITVAAPAEAAYARTTDLHRYREWNPWAQVDPAMEEQFEGPPSGVGASYSWASKKVGAGRLTVTDDRPGDLVRMRLEMLEPMPSTSTADFIFQRQGDQTVVTWTMYGPQTFAGKAMDLFFSMDRMVGSEFEKGLARLKTLVETPGGTSVVANER